MLSSRVWRLALLTFFLIGPPLRARRRENQSKKKVRPKKPRKRKESQSRTREKGTSKRNKQKELAKGKGLSPNPSIRANGQVHLHDKRAEKKVEGDKEKFGEPHEHGCELANTGNEKIKCEQEEKTRQKRDRPQ